MRRGYFHGRKSARERRFERRVANARRQNLDYWKGRVLRRTYRSFRPCDLGRQHDVYYTIATLARLLETCGSEVVARSKAIWRRKLGNNSPAHALFEALRFGVLWTWQALAGLSRLRREIVLVGRYPSPPGQP